jgi:P27 family predicted phage terminase small subunit
MRASAIQNPGGSSLLQDYREVPVRRTSNESKALRGTLRADRMRQAPDFAQGASCPRYLDKVAKTEWHRVAPELKEKGILTEVSQALLAAYCQSYALWRSALEDIAKDGAVLMVSSTTRTGQTITPKPNPAVKNALQFQRAMLDSARLFGLSPLHSGLVESNPIQPAPEFDPVADLLS